MTRTAGFHSDFGSGRLARSDQVKADQTRAGQIRCAWWVGFLYFYHDSSWIPR